MRIKNLKKFGFSIFLVSFIMTVSFAEEPADLIQPQTEETVNQTVVQSTSTVVATDTTEETIPIKQMLSTETNNNIQESETYTETTNNSNNNDFIDLSSPLSFAQSQTPVQPQTEKNTDVRLNVGFQGSYMTLPVMVGETLLFQMAGTMSII